MVAIRMHRLLRGRGKERGGRGGLRASTSEARGGRGGGELVVLLLRLLLLLLLRHLRRAVDASKIEARQTTSASSIGSLLLLRRVALRPPSLLHPMVWRQHPSTSTSSLHPHHPSTSSKLLLMLQHLELLALLLLPSLLCPRGRLGLLLRGQRLLLREDHRLTLLHHPLPCRLRLLPLPLRLRRRPLLLELLLRRPRVLPPLVSAALPLAANQIIDIVSAKLTDRTRR